MSEISIELIRLIKRLIIEYQSRPVSPEELVALTELIKSAIELSNFY